MDPPTRAGNLRQFSPPARRGREIVVPPARFGNVHGAMRPFSTPTKAALPLLLGLATAVSLPGCKREGRDKSTASEWIDHPSSGTKSGNTITIAPLGVKFQVPETLYVYKSCGEAAHSPEGDHGWIPVITCRSTNADAFGGGGDEEGSEDPFASEDAEEASGVDEIAITFYVTHKTRPLDERSVTWFESQYKQAGLVVDEISYQHDFQKKSGIYAKLHVGDEGSGAPHTEIVQFMFPRNDVVFIARMEYPFGEKRSVDQDWKYILWNFELQ